MIILMRSLRLQSRKCFPDGWIHKKEERIHQKMKVFSFIIYRFQLFILWKSTFKQTSTKDGEVRGENSEHSRGGKSPLEAKWNINLIKPGYEYRGMKIEAMASMAHAIKNLPAMQETRVWSRGQRDDLPGRSLGAGYGNLLQYFCQENAMDRGACWATVRGVAKSQTGLSD